MSDDEIITEESDPAADAFSRLEGEIALMRRAVQQLAAEKAAIIIPDYNPTLREMSKRLAEMVQTLAAVADKPAMELTPESMAQKIDSAARRARQTDHDELRRAHDRYFQASRDLQGVVATAYVAHEQRRRLLWAAGGSLLAGMLLWSFLPGVFLRVLPQSWHMPENMARHIIGEPTLWEAGTRLMRAGNPEGWQEIVDAADMRHRNREKIAGCEQAAAEAKETVRCTIRIRARHQSGG